MRRPLRCRPLVVAVILSCAPSRAAAYRPFVSTDAAVAGPREVEIEFGYAGFRRNGASTSIVAPTVIANVGLGHELELVGEFKLVNDLSHRTEERETSRFEDSAVSIKWIAREGALQEHGSGPSLGVEVSALLPSLRGQRRPGGELVGIASGTAHGWTYHLNGGGLVEPGGDQPGLIWGVIVEHAMFGRLRGVAELNGESVRTNEAQNSALVGAIWDVEAPSPLHGLSLDLGVRHGISGSADEWAGTAGFTVAF
jgi:hypothetical protein